jgi:hypothetical protein
VKYRREIRCGIFREHCDEMKRKKRPGGPSCPESFLA